MLKSAISLLHERKQHTTGIDKAVAPSDTVRRIKELLKSLSNHLVSDVARIDSGRLDIPVYVCNAGKDCNIPSPKTMGKGPTADQSEASALMEMMERYSHANFPGRHACIRGSYQEIGPDTLPLDHFFYVPDRCARAAEESRMMFSRLPFAWVPAFSLSRKRDFLIPYEWFADIQGTNGLSAGNTMTETVLQGLCEVVERHVCARVNSGRLAVPEIDLGSVRDPVARDLLGKFYRHRIRLVCLDFSLDTGMPTVAGIAFDPSTFPNSEIVYCAGTATHPEKALIRVLTEIQQMAVDFFKLDYYEGGILPKFRHPGEFEFLFDDRDPVPIQSLPDVSSEDLLEEIEHCTDSLGRIGFEPLVINISHPDLGVPAVFVIMAGSQLYEMSIKRLNGLYFLARRLKFIGRLEEAMDMFRRSMVQYPESTGHCTMELGDCLRLLGSWQEAMAAYRSASFHPLDRALKMRLFRSMEICSDRMKASTNAL